MSVARFIIVLMIVLCLRAAAALAAEPVRVMVSSVSGRSVFLNAGRAAGLAPGMRVRLFPPGAAPIDAVISDVSTSSARIELLRSVQAPPVGTMGEVDVPEAPPVADPSPPASQPATQPATAPIEHPPWERTEARSPDQPLLAPAYSKPASERPPTIHGRAFTQFQLSFDSSEGRDSQYLLARFGTDFEVTNPFGQGGRLQFNGEYDLRRADLLDDGALTENDLILNRLSYAIGGEVYSPYRLEFGRFLPYYLPEIGIVDGVEGALLLENGLTFGAGGGLYPLDLPERDWGADAGFHVFVDYQARGGRPFAATLGYQKTWHDGEADRDVIFARVSATPTPSLWLYGSAKLDIYGGDDSIKSSGIDLTEAFAQARWSLDASTGVSASYSRYTWAEIKRGEFVFLPIELVRDGHVDRAETTIWREVAKDLRLTVRGNYFVDQDGDGFGGEFDVDWSRIGGLSADLHADVFYTKGSFTEGEGLRFEFRPNAGDLQGFIGYELFHYTNSGLVSGEEYFDRHTFRAGVNLQIHDWYYSLTLDRYFGDFEDAWSLGAYIEYRF